ncbi:hypothetical protein SAMN04487818_103448 [Actinokineospora terrae]|uniref:Uncharacterized protein n=1 Tax=Actinokineospora terrae TaxID=155974 RepID=A0A1H9PHL6_9PSEU|nr:hypothetical protein SAMN04487818_103448 [Actinokineospora terrae]
MDDFRTFRGTCHALARHTAATAVEFRLATGVTPNFHECVLTYHTEVLAPHHSRRSPLQLLGLGAHLSSVDDLPSKRRATMSCWICWVPSKMSNIFESRAHFSSREFSL